MNTRSIQAALAALALLAAVASAADKPAAPAHGGAEGHAQPAAATGGHDAHGQADGHQQANIFEGGFGNMVWTTITFAIVVYILGTKAWPPLMKALSEREKLIREALESAARDRDEAKRMMQQYEQQLLQARAEASAIVEEGRRDAEAVRQRIQEEARSEAEAMIARAKHEIHLSADAAIKDLYDRTAELAVQVAGGIIHKSLNPDDHRGLVQESLAQIRAAGIARRN